MDRQKMDGRLSWVEQRDQLGFGCYSASCFSRGPVQGKNAGGERSRGVGHPTPSPEPRGPQGPRAEACRAGQQPRDLCESPAPFEVLWLL